MRELRKEIRAEINKAKVNYKDKIETEFRNKNPRAAWNGMKKCLGVIGVGTGKLVWMVSTQTHSSLKVLITLT